MVQEHIPVPNKMHQEEQQKATALASAAFISSLGDQEALERLWTVSPRGKYQHDPRLYFSALVQLAKVLKVQHETVEAFDAKPRPPGRKVVPWP